MPKYNEFSRIADMPRLAHYLRYLIRVHRGKESKEIMERLFPRYRSNVRHWLDLLGQKMNFKDISDKEFKELDAVLFEIEGVSDLLKLSEKAIFINRMLNKMKLEDVDTILDELMKSDKENNERSKKIQNVVIALRSQGEVTEALTRNLMVPPPFDAFVAIYKNLVSIAQRWMQWRAMQYDPLLRSKGTLKKQAIKWGALGSFVSLLASTVLLVKYYDFLGPILGVIGGPIVLLAAAGISLGGRLMALGASFLDLYREFKEKEPKETYKLRTMKRVSRIAHVLVSCGFRALIFLGALAAVAAFANPVGLPILAGIAVGVAVFSLTNYLFSRYYLDKKILKIGADLKTKKSLRKKPSRKMPKKIQVGPNRKVVQAKEFTYAYRNNNASSVKILVKENNVSTKRSMHQAQLIAEKNNRKYSCVRNSVRTNQYTILDMSKPTVRKRIAEVGVFKTGSSYTVFPDQQDPNIKILLKSVVKNKPEKIVLSGKNLKEILKIYKIALQGKLFLQMSKQTKEQFRALPRDSPMRKEWLKMTIQMKKMKTRLESEQKMQKENLGLKPGLLSKPK